MPKATEKIELTDAQVVKNAWRLIRSTDVKDSLPPRHTLSDIWRASRQVQNLGLPLLETHGERLKRLDSSPYLELESWKNSAI